MDSEAIPLTNCEAMYQAAVSKRADHNIPSGVVKPAHGHVLFQLYVMYLPELPALIEH